MLSKVSISDQEFSRTSRQFLLLCFFIVGGPNRFICFAGAVSSENHNTMLVSPPVSQCESMVCDSIE